MDNACHLPGRTSLFIGKASLVLQGASPSSSKAPFLVRTSSLPVGEASFIFCTAFLLDDNVSLAVRSASLLVCHSSVLVRKASLSSAKGSLLEDHASLLDRDASLLDGDASLLDRDASLLDRDASLLEGDASLLEDDASPLEDDASLLDDDASLLEDDASLLDDEASFALVRASLCSSHELLSKPGATFARGDDAFAKDRGGKRTESRSLPVHSGPVYARSAGLALSRGRVCERSTGPRERPSTAGSA